MCTVSNSYAYVHARTHKCTRAHARREREREREREKERETDRERHRHKHTHARARALSHTHTHTALAAYAYSCSHNRMRTHAHIWPAIQPTLMPLGLEFRGLGLRPSLSGRSHTYPKTHTLMHIHTTPCICHGAARSCAVQRERDFNRNDTQERPWVMIAVPFESA